MMISGLKKKLPADLLDKFQIICSRVRELEPNKKRILWLHDTYDDPENDHLKDPKNWEKFDLFVFVSYYQFTTYHLNFGIPHNKSLILNNAIEPLKIGNKPDDVVRLIYHTTPHRGLGLLVPAFIEIAKRYQNITLDVFSSFDIYGWKDRNVPYEPLYEMCRKHPQINYHGTQSNDVVREYLSASHIFAYPCIWPETACISAMEALSANCRIVFPDFAALPETIFDHTYMYRYDEEPIQHCRKFMYVLENAILDVTQKKSFTSTAKLARVKYGWHQRAAEWEQLLRNMS